MVAREPGATRSLPNTKGSRNGLALPLGAGLVGLGVLFHKLDDFSGHIEAGRLFNALDRKSTRLNSSH